MKEQIDALQREEIQDYLVKHESADIQKFLLRQTDILGLPTAVIAQQLAGRAKAKHKLPTLYKTRGIVYPPSVNLEQCSSEATASFKQSLVNGQGADLTGGFGIDSFFLGKQAHIDYVDPDTDLVEIVKHNHKILGATAVTHFSSTAEAYLDTIDSTLDFLYLDPSRRRDTQKIVRLSQSVPDVVNLHHLLIDKAAKVIVKASPMMDLKKGLAELSHVAEIIVLAVENECKELLFILQKDAPAEPRIRSVDLHRGGEILNDISFRFSEEKETVVGFHEPQEFLYEPGVAILKAGAFKWTAVAYNLLKLAPDTHLYTGSEIIHNFPGRIFKVINAVKLDGKLKTHFEKGYANILVRNYPLTVESIKKKTGLKEGGAGYLICTQTKKEKFTLVAERIK